MPVLTKPRGFKYDKLSEDAKEKARDWWRECSAEDAYWAEFPIEEAKTFGKILGLDIEKVYYSGFSSQGDGACFEGRWYAGNVNEEQVLQLKKECPKDTTLQQLADEFIELKKWFPESSAKIEHRGHYYHRYCTDLTVDLGDEDEYPSDPRDGENGQIVLPNTECEAPNDVYMAFEKALTESCRDYMQWIYHQLEEAYDHDQSDEAVEESILANDYLFDEDGEVI